MFWHVRVERRVIRARVLWMYELKELKDVLRKRVSFGTYNLKESREVLSEHVRVRTRAV